MIFFNKKLLASLLFIALVLPLSSCCRFGCKKPKSVDLGVDWYREPLNRILENCRLDVAFSPRGFIEATESWMLSEEEREKGSYSQICIIKDQHAFYNDLSLLNMTQIVPAHSASYGTVVIFGGALPVMRQRLDFLIREWRRGVRFERIIFLCGERPLYPGIEEKEHFINKDYNPFSSTSAPIDKDSYKQKCCPQNQKNTKVINNQNIDEIELKDLPENEVEIAKFVWEQMDLPKAWKGRGGIDVMFLSAHSRENKKFTGRRDTLTYLQYEETEFDNRVLFISSQPFIHLDLHRIKDVLTHFRKGFDIAGPGFSQGVLKQTWAPRVCLHTIAVLLSETEGVLQKFPYENS